MSTSIRSAPAVQSPPAWPGRNHVSTFVHCLHLLDLDKLDDWPGVTEQTFSTKSAQQNLQSRVRAIEWSLYRLFELYDAAETREKFRPFFPPLAPLQSVNLRAALYRCLTELKKNGVLGKEIILRKTMLDECKGDKFEEVIAAFAVTVLKRVTSKNGRLKTCKYAEYQQLPMVLAYRKSLQENLRRRENLRRKHEEDIRMLRDAEQTIRDRIAQAEKETVAINPGVAEDLRSLLHANWVGERGWIDIALHGPPIKPIIDLSKFGGGSGLQTECDIAASSNRLLDDLELKIKSYQSRLDGLIAIKDSLESGKPAKSVPFSDTKVSAAARRQKIEFSKHQELQLGHAEIKQGENPTPRLEYQQLLFNMQQQIVYNQPNNTPEKLPFLHHVPLPGPRPDGNENTMEERKEAPSVKAGNITHGKSNGHSSPILQSIKQSTHESSSPPSPISVISDDINSSWISKLRAITSIPNTPVPALKEQLYTSQPTSANVNLQMKSPGSPEKEWFSLMDRTRASVANAHGHEYPFDPDSPETKLDETTMSDNLNLSVAGPRSVLMDDQEHRSTLLERTRQSMSLITMNKIRPRKQPSTKSSRTSQLFPANQFETPGRKSVMMDLDGTEVGSSRSSTPREKLFEEEADYASVFKSRPKIAMSPVMLSPERSGAGLESILEVDMQRLDLGSEYENWKS